MRDTRMLKGFLLSFFLHLLLFLLFFVSFKRLNILPPPSSKQETKITLNLSRFTPPAPKPQPKPMPPIATPSAPRKNPAIQKPLSKPKTPLSVTKKRNIEKRKPLPTTFRLPKKYTKDRLANTLLRGLGHSSNRKRPSHRSKPDRMIQRMYGKEFYSFTKTQQKFIKNHLSEIRRITQNTLVINGYPDVAMRTGQQGTNVVSFYLHPNGDISHLRLIRPMGYEALDKNTITVIQIAYKDYPRPKTKTKIVFYVNYSLY